MCCFTLQRDSVQRTATYAAMRLRRRETGLHQTPAVESAADDPIKVAMDAAVEVMSVTVDVLVAIGQREFVEFAP